MRPLGRTRKAKRHNAGRRIRLGETGRSACRGPGPAVFRLGWQTSGAQGNELPPAASGQVSLRDMASWNVEWQPEADKAKKRLGARGGQVERGVLRFLDAVDSELEWAEVIIDVTWGPSMMVTVSLPEVSRAIVEKLEPSAERVRGLAVPTHVSGAVVMVAPTDETAPPQGYRIVESRLRSRGTRNNSTVISTTSGSPESAVSDGGVAAIQPEEGTGPKT